MSLRRALNGTWMFVGAASIMGTWFGLWTQAEAVWWVATSALYIGGNQVLGD